MWAFLGFIWTVIISASCGFIFGAHLYSGKPIQKVVAEMPVVFGLKDAPIDFSDVAHPRNPDAPVVVPDTDAPIGDPELNALGGIRSPVAGAPPDPPTGTVDLRSLIDDPDKK